MISTLHGSELHCEFGTVWQDIFKWAYNLCITYPYNDIIILANLVKSCFQQIKYHVDVVDAFSYILA
jgi:hypothetical protein